MDYETISAEAFGASLTGIGLNILVRDVRRQVHFLTEVFGVEAHQITDDFAIIRYHGSVMQVHSDGTYHSNPLPSLIPEAGARGGGAEFRFYHTHPDAAQARAEAIGAHVLQPAKDKPHGLREAYILCENGYAWVASLPL
ncbi:glyoxalase [Pseudohalocynthiibacter aestuariivivens]|uniref:Glyoxalase n=1 Tax=Roseovarius pelagicus TaxID=2980108 RepID=A0ABY6DDB0_9RHOB|nr:MULTISPECIES: VOC family protein [Rhodobacterales]QIE46219.1 glyoxalase [Pseudohalocynthiibacter aestuariivivens]UXX81815.1 glyoxalase [Roseovarius pelagicus]